SKLAKQTTTHPNAPNHTFATNTTLGAVNNSWNNPRDNPFQWLVFDDRPIAGALDLLHVSGYKPHELTQQFMTAATQFRHQAPWFDPRTRIHRLFEFLEGGFRFQWSPVGGRGTGRVNINTIWDPDTFNALCGARVLNNYAISFFTQNEVNSVYAKLTS